MVLVGEWGTGDDAVIIGGNSLYELQSLEEQESCIRCSWRSLRPGGWLLVDNDNYKGDWGRLRNRGPVVVFEGTTREGKVARWLRHDIRFDEQTGVLHFKRILQVTDDTGATRATEYLGRKRPVTGREVAHWL